MGEGTVGEGGRSIREWLLVCPEVVAVLAGAVDAVCVGTHARRSGAVCIGRHRGGVRHVRVLGRSDGAVVEALIDGPGPDVVYGTLMHGLLGRSEAELIVGVEVEDV